MRNKRLNLRHDFKNNKNFIKKTKKVLLKYFVYDTINKRK